MCVDNEHSHLFTLDNKTKKKILLEGKEIHTSTRKECKTQQACHK